CHRDKSERRELNDSQLTSETSRLFGCSLYSRSAQQPELEFVPLPPVDEWLSIRKRLRLHFSAGLLEDASTDERHRAAQQQRPHAHAEHPPEYDAGRHRLPVDELGACGSPRLAVQRNQHEAHDHFARRLEHSEQWSAPRPFTHGESSEVERRHPEQKQGAQHERGTEVGGSRITVGEDDSAEKAYYDARNQSELDGRSRDPGEGCRFLEVPF